MGICVAQTMMRSAFPRLCPGGAGSCWVNWNRVLGGQPGQELAKTVPALVVTDEERAEARTEVRAALAPAEPRTSPNWWRH